jgi:hypothetical protein
MEGDTPAPQSSFAVEKDHTHTCNTLAHSNANALTHSQATCTHAGRHAGMYTNTHARAQTNTHHLVGGGGRACRLLVLALVSRAWSQVSLVLGQHTQTNAGDEDLGRGHDGWGAWAFRSTASLHQRLQLKQARGSSRPPLLAGQRGSARGVRCTHNRSLDRPTRRVRCTGASAASKRARNQTSKTGSST